MFKFRGASGTIDQEPYEIHEKWTTPNVSEMDQKGVPSPRMTASDKTWRIICYPKGYKTTDYFSVIFYCCKLKEDHNVKFSIQTLDGKKTAKQFSEYNFSSAVPNRGFFEFIPLDDLDSYTVDGKLIFQIDIIFDPPQSKGINYRKTVGFIGLQNQGCTCYMNSALECLFHIIAFRKIVFQLPTNGKEDVKTNIPLALQRLFILLQKSSFSPSTQELTNAFGWGTLDVFLQHDVQEFLNKLIDNIEKKMKGTDNENAIASLFRGKTVNFIKCLTVDYSSEREELFYDIQLPVKNMKNIEESLRSSIQDETLEGKNQYEAEGYGKVDALMGARYLELPPVLNVLLKRFDYDNYTGQLVKVGNRFEFPFELDMLPYMSEKANHDECYTYELFSVLVQLGTSYGGHYYAFARTSPERKWYKFDDDSVSIVDEKTAIDDNFGGQSKLYSAYYLVYIRKTEIEKIMAPIKNEDIPSHLRDYYQEWKSQHNGLPPNIYLQILNEKAYGNSIKMNGQITPDLQSLETPIKTPVNIKFKDLLPEFKRRAGINPESDAVLWTLGPSGFPSRQISPECNINQHFRSSSKMFVTENNQELKSIKLEDARPFIISFYDPKASDSLRFIKFVVLTVKSNFVPLEKEVRSILNINDDSVKLNAYYCRSKDKIQEINTESTIDELKATNGMIVFQLPPNHETTYTIPTEKLEENDNSVKLYRSINLIPELKAETYPEFNEFINFATLYNFSAIDEPDNITFKLLINNNGPLSSFLRSVRKSLNLSDRDSVLLFTKDTKGLPSKRPIDFSSKVTIRQLIFGKSLFYKIIENTSQEELAKKVSFKISVVNENLEVLQAPILLMPKSFQVDDVIGRIKENKIVPQDKPVRLLQIIGSRIIKIMDQDTNLSHQVDYNYRAEVIPEDQIDCPEDHLIRVTLSIDLTIPINGCSGTPFIFRIEDNEKFADTKERLSKIIKESSNKLSFAYTNNCIELKNFKMLKDDDVLSDLLHGNNTMIFAFIPVDHRRAVRNKPFSWNSGVTIYN